MTVNDKMSGMYVGKDVGQGNYNAKNVIEDFMKTEYEEGFRNEFAQLDALINKLPKDTITGKKKYKSFKLGISDNIRAVGKGAFDTYELGLTDFSGRGGETVDAEFDTTKLMATFAISDEAILKGTGDGSLIDVLRDQLSDMEVGMKHTMNRYTYGSYTGKIGALSYVSGKLLTVVSLSDVTGDNISAGHLDPLDIGREIRGEAHNWFRYGKAPKVVSFQMTNSHSLMAGMGALIQYQAGSSLAQNDIRLVGYIWQKDNTSIHQETVLFIVEKAYEWSGSAWVLDSDFSCIGSSLPASGTSAVATVYSRQLDDTTGTIAREYTGLEDIVVTQNNKIFGVNRAIYKSLNCTAVDMDTNNDGVGDVYLNEEILRDLTDHIALSSPEGTAITLCCANHRIISQVEKSLYQFKNYNLADVGKGMQLGGGNELKFDNYVLHKDAFARDNNLYLLDQNKIGELVRRDFTWITSGEVNGVLQRRDGTEFYEGIMNKYADMYIDAWRCHAVIKHCKVVAPGSYFSYNNDGTPKAQGDPVEVKITAVADGVEFPTGEAAAGAGGNG